MLLIFQGAVFNIADYDGRTPLHVAASEGHVNVVEYLLDCGAHVHVRDRHGFTALDEAVTFGHHEIIDLLIQTGAHITKPPARVATDLCK